MGQVDVTEKLDVGEQFGAEVEQDDELNQWLYSGNLWCAVKHSFSTKPALGKISSPLE
jgi:hypothetical protein